MATKQIVILCRRLRKVKLEWIALLLERTFRIKDIESEEKSHWHLPGAEGDWEKLEAKSKTTIEAELDGSASEESVVNQPATDHWRTSMTAPESMMKVSWKPKLAFYSEKIGVRFANRYDVDNVFAAIDDPKNHLYGMPWMYVGSGTLVVPADAWDILYKAGYKVTRVSVQQRGCASVV